MALDRVFFAVLCVCLQREEHVRDLVRALKVSSALIPQDLQVGWSEDTCFVVSHLYVTAS